MKVLFLTQSIYPLSGGRILGSHGYAKELSKISDLVVFSPIRGGDKLKQETVRFCENNDIEGRFVVTTSINNVKSVLQESFTRMRGKFTMTVPIYTEFYRCIEDYIANNDVELVIIDHIAMYQYYKRLRNRFKNVVFIYNAHNVEFINTTHELNEGNNYFKKQINKVRCTVRKSYERNLIDQCEWIFSVSKSDIEILSKEFGNKDKFIYAKPLIRFDKIKTIQDVEKCNRNLLIVGSMNWYPNVKGILWFVKNVFNRIQAVNPDMKLFLVGGNPCDEIKKLASSSIIVTGFVESTSEYFNKCDISIIPVFEGTGAKIKVLESIGRGIPTVCSGFAAKDYDLNDEVLIANDADEFYEYIESLINSSEQRRLLYGRMDKYYASYYELNPKIVNIVKRKR